MDRSDIDPKPIDTGLIDTELIHTAAGLLERHGELGAITRLRDAGVPAAAVSAAIDQVRLRARAAAKFGPAADRMWFTSDGLEQATGELVATHRAARIARYAPGGRVADLCCGIGGDLAALSAAGLQVTGYDLDPVTTELARRNLAALDLPGRVECADVLGVDLDRFAAFVIDPARRDQGRRTFDPAAYRPDWPSVCALLDRHTGVATVAPGIRHDQIPAGAEAEWVSTPEGLKEAAVWSGGLAGRGRRASVLFGPGVSATMTSHDPCSDAIGAVGNYLYEPDPAVVRAGLVTTLAAALDARRLDPRIAYLTADAVAPTAFADCFEVLEELRPRRVRDHVRGAAPAALEILVRGVRLDPAAERRRLLAGTRPTGPALTLVHTRIGDTHTVFATRRLTDRGGRGSVAAAAT